MQRKKLIELACILDLDNYTRSLDRWLQMPIHIGREHQRQNCFDQYLHIVKPKIHKYHQIVTALDPKQYGFYSKDLKQGQLKALVDAYKQLEKFQTLSQNELASLQQDGKYGCLSQEEFQGMLVKPDMPIFRIELKEKPKNKELPYWGNYLNVPPLTFQSVVIHGKGIARISLGFPTANLQVTHQIEQKLNSYPNGIYVVQFTFLKGQSYYGICSIGTNPHYQNALNRRLVQVYIYNDFGESMFYGAQIILTILVLTRFQGKFSSFDEFLNAMHNDIESGRIISERLGKL